MKSCHCKIVYYSFGGCSKDHNILMFVLSCFIWNVQVIVLVVLIVKYMKYSEHISWYTFFVILRLF